MSAAKNRTPVEQEISDVEYAALNEIQCPVKLSKLTKEQVGPVGAHILQARLNEAFAFNRSGEGLMEYLIQTLGVIVVFAACWMIGLALYAQL